MVSSPLIRFPWYQVRNPLKKKKKHPESNIKVSNMKPYGRKNKSILHINLGSSPQMSGKHLVGKTTSIFFIHLDDFDGHLAVHVGWFQWIGKHPSKNSTKRGPKNQL